VLGRILIDYLATVVPLARRRLEQWSQEAARIPDPLLRRHALAALAEKRSNPEAVAVFAILAPRRRRRATVGAIVSLQIAIDYLDSLGEQAGSDPLRDGLSLHRALPAAVQPGAAPDDWYRLHPRQEDGGYLSRLVGACQTHLQTLPASGALASQLAATAQRCGEGQSHTHGAGQGDSAALERWALLQSAPAGYRWWEVAAGASSSVATHALIALAARPDGDTEQANRIDAAYFPPIGALTVLLDDLVDREYDRARGEHNYTNYYGNAAEAAERMGLLASRASLEVACLPQASKHAAILDGVLGFYLGAAKRMPYAQPVRQRLLGERVARRALIAAVAGLQRRLQPHPDQ
jgi:tetraprenyl-beta-curcumene synthase